MSAALGWPAATPVMRLAQATAILAFSAPLDQLMLATEVNEWAWEMAVGLIGPPRQGAPDQTTNQATDPAAQYQARYQALHQATPTFTSALGVFAQRALDARNPALMSLLDAARQHQVPFLADDQCVTLGSGRGSQTWALTGLPAVASVAWEQIYPIPALLVSGTNGKTTSVRLLAAMATQTGQQVGYCCTEGVFIDGVEREAGDFSGPGGARTVLRQTHIDLAVLETARGGILRRGLALDSAPVALITNVSPEHFGEYGIDHIHALAEVKLVLAQAVQPGGTLVLNADDPILLAYATAHAKEHAKEYAPRQTCKLALFALDYAHPALQAQRAQGAACCGVQAGRLRAFAQQQEFDLGDICAMPLTLQGHAHYNIANCAGAALSALALGIAPDRIAQVLSRFGQVRQDNPGRLEHWHLPDLTVLIDYAHNPEGLHGLLSVAQGFCQRSTPPGRLGLLLGQAGNRSDAAIADLATLAVQFAPERIVLKDLAGYMRGRQAGEVPALLHAQLIQAGMSEEKIATILSEVEAACSLLGWAKTDDVLVLPVHDKQSKKRLQELLDTLQDAHWHCGQPLPL